MKGPVQNHSLPNLQLSVSSCVYFSVSPSLCSRLSMYRQRCALKTRFRLQSTDLPGYTWQWAVRQDVWISPRHNGFVKPMLRQTEGEGRTAKVEGTTAEQSIGVRWYCQVPALHCAASGFFFFLPRLEPAFSYHLSHIYIAWSAQRSVEWPVSPSLATEGWEITKQWINEVPRFFALTCNVFQFSKTLLSAARPEAVLSARELLLTNSCTPKTLLSP